MSSSSQFYIAIRMHVRCKQAFLRPKHDRSKSVLSSQINAALVGIFVIGPLSSSGSRAEIAQNVIERADASQCTTDNDVANKSRCANRVAELIAQAKELQTSGKLDESLATLTEAIKLDETNALPLIERANIKARKRDYEGAIRDLTDALRLRGQNAAALVERGNAYHALRQYAAAVQDYDAALEITPRRAFILNNKGVSSRAAGDRAKAIESYLSAIQADPVYTLAYSNLTRLYESETRYDDAAEQYERGIAAFDVANKSDLDLATLLYGLAWVRQNLGDLNAAAKTYERLLTLRERLQGDSHIDVGFTLATLAATYSFQGRYKEAETALIRALAIAQRHNDLTTLAPVHFSLGILHGLQRSFTKSQVDFQNSAAAYAKQSPVDNVAVGKSLVGLANAYWQAGKFEETANAALRALQLIETSAGPNDPALASALEALASAYYNLDRNAEAENLLRRTIAIYETGLGKDSLQSASALQLLAEIYRSQNNYQRASEVYHRVLKLREQKLGRNHPDTAQTLFSLGDVHRAQGDYKQAEELYKDSLEIREKTLPNSLVVGWSLTRLGALYKETDRPVEALAAYERALEINEKVLGPNHQDLAYLLDDIAILYRSIDNSRLALYHSRRATTSLTAAAAEQIASAPVSPGARDLVGRRHGYFIRHLRALNDAAQEQLEPLESLAREAFEVAQLTNLSATAAAMQQMSARFASGNDALAGLVRQRQDQEAAWKEREKALTSALADPNRATREPAVNLIRNELAELEAKLVVVSQQMSEQFPDYAVLSRPRPSSVQDVQKALSADEALIFFVVGTDSSYVFSVTQNSVDWGRLPLGEKELSRDVAEFRTGLDIGAVEQIYESISTAAAPKLFNLAKAHDLYEQLFSPVANSIAGKRHLIIAPAGPLTALPFHLLVMEAPQSAVPDSITGYRDAAYLAKQQSISILPSVSSLRTLSIRGYRSARDKKLVAFGDPIFGKVETRVASRSDVVASSRIRGYAGFWQGGSIDRSELANLPRLPETADEIHAIARQLGASTEDIHLGRDATEHAVKTATLSSYQVVYFATHGLVAGDVDGLGEPALALSLPDVPTADDDGLLTASEAAQLKLNADWVVLSACNTFAGDKPGAEALSGLARAFFYAGARALLVSHWPLESSAATNLTTSTFGFLDDGVAHSEALRRAMLKFMNDSKDPRHAYPAFWAPFVVIGRE